MMLDGKDNVLQPHVDKLQDVSRTAVQLVGQERVCVAAVDPVVHIMGWHMLLPRPTLSVSLHSYGCCQKWSGGRLWSLAASPLNWWPAWISKWTIAHKPLTTP